MYGLKVPRAGAYLGAWCVLLCSNVSAYGADDAEADADTVVVLGNRPTSLPTEIPTTIEGITGDKVLQVVNATDAEDALKYFPSLLVRKRYIGDYDHAVLATRASGTGNSARSLIYADGILLSNLLGNGATFTPRWGLVAPEEIERVDVLYGPFSAAYSGNSVGAVVDYVTRMPTRFEAHVKASAFTSHFDDYGIDGHFSGYQATASLGDKNGALSWWANYNRLDSDAQPIVFANKLVSTGSLPTTGTPVTGALFGQNPRQQDWWLIGTTTQTHTIQDHGKVKLAYDFNDAIRLSYTLGIWRNDSERNSNSYLRDAAGNPIYSTPSGFIVIAGRQYSLLATDFAPSIGDLRHVMHGLSLKSNAKSTFDWEVAASLYDYAKDITRSPTIALPVASAGGAGRITDMDGTGWNTLALRGVWRPDAAGTHIVDVGYQREAFKLSTRVSDTDNWISGGPSAFFSSFKGETELQSVFGQDTWRFAQHWRTTLGMRIERWNAFDGVIQSSTSAPPPFAERLETNVSPKMAVAYKVTDDWEFKASLGRAVRMPTVSELYQGTTSNNTIINNDPNLRPEKSWTGELTAEGAVGSSMVRATVFHEDTRDALYSQVNVLSSVTVSTIQNVDHIRTTGVELSYVATNIGIAGFDLTSSITFADSIIAQNDKFPASVGKWQPRVPRWRANLLAAYRFADAWNFTVGARYSGQQYSTLDNSDPNSYSYTGVSKFFVVDLRARYRFAKQWTASLGVDNANNYRYWNFHNYPERTFVAELSWDL